MFVPRSLQTTSHSAVLVPAAALCLGLLGWSRGADDPRLNDLAIGFAHGNRPRTATLVIPDGVPPAAGWPVVLLLHGAGGSGDKMVRSDGWRDVALREHFVVVAPDGIPANEARRPSFVGNMRTWNSGDGGGLATTGTSAYAKGVDDVDYLLALLDTTAQRVRINAKRVYVAGHSNGAGMAYRVAAEHPERFAALGVMAGHLYSDAPSSLPTSVSLIQIVGEKDPLMPFDGGVVRNGAGGTTTLRPALDAPTRWAAMSGITAAPRIVRDDSITVRQWGPSAAGTVVVSDVVKGHGHGWLWPGADRLPERLIGPRRDALNATETMWAFFEAHRRK
jgi:polyhydroxybutyrate depolymerase